MADQEEEGIILYDGLEEAFIGIVERFGMNAIACYDQEKALAGFVKDGMTWEDAVEHFAFNVIGGWVGERTPCFLTRMTLEEAREQFTDG